MEKQVFYQRGNIIRMSSPPTTSSPVIPNGVWDLHLDMMGFYLEKKKEQFEFPYKVYNLETEFIDHAIKTFDESNKNLGVLLNGTKGTGKTVTAQSLCNRLGMPVIMVNQHFDGFVNFLSQIPHNFTLFLDEYDKNFQEKNAELLTLMDGALSTQYKTFFILTSNSNATNANMMERPSRIRYVKTFGDLKQETVLEVIDDYLKYPEFREDVVNFVSGLNIITIDIVKEVIKEVNIHQKSPEDFKSIFNVTSAEPQYRIFAITPNGNRKELMSGTDINFKPDYLNKKGKMINRSFYYDTKYDDKYVGEIIEVIDNNTIVLQMNDISGIENANITLTLLIEPKRRIHDSMKKTGFTSNWQFDSLLRNPENYLELFNIEVYDENHPHYNEHYGPADVEALMKKVEEKKAKSVYSTYSY